MLSKQQRIINALKAARARGISALEAVVIVALKLGILTKKFYSSSPSTHFDLANVPNFNVLIRMDIPYL